MAKTQAWLASSLQRQFPLKLGVSRRSLDIPAARGERVSFQLCVRIEGDKPLAVEPAVEFDPRLTVQVRRVGCVPVPHHNTDTPLVELDGLGHIPGYVPDVLFPEQRAVVPPYEVTAFWVTVDVPHECTPGVHEGNVTLQVEDRRPKTLQVRLLVSEVVLRKRRDFRVTHWFYADALMDWYGTRLTDEDFWPICERYMRNYAEHGSDTIYVPVFTPPLDGVKRPTQLLKVNRNADGRYRFDWRLVKRWIETARKAGVEFFEWTHLFTQWGAAHAIRIYENHGDDAVLLWPPEVGANSNIYREFLSQFLPALHRFLQEENLLERSFFHLSDEPHDEHLENYRQARNMLRDLAPWMTVMDALSDICFAREGLTDMPIPSIKTMKQFADAGIPSWAYFCCGPRGKYLNRLMDTPPAKIRMAGWLLYRFGAKGFLHWGYNYWYKRQTQQMIDPFTVSNGLAWPGWAYGDTFEVYPGPDGPLDSIRWEIFAESLQDYALLQTLNIDSGSPLLERLRSFDDFPKDEQWLTNARRTLLHIDG